jgi:murein DD-endopeptidase MepM/ murein hydrolase activator NlpD
MGSGTDRSEPAPVAPVGRRPDRRLPWLPGGRRVRGAVAVVLAAATGGLVMVVSSPPAVAGIQSEQAQAAAVQQQIVIEGQAVQALVERADAAQAHLDAVRHEVAVDAAQLAADRRAQAEAVQRLRRVAVTAYMDGGQPGGSLSMFETGSAEGLVERQAYTSMAAGSLRDAIDADLAAAHRTQQAAAAEHAAAAAATAAVEQLDRQQQQAQAALAQDDQLLRQINGTIAGMEAAAALQRLAAQEVAQEEQMAAAQAAAQAAAIPPPPVVHAAPGSYVNPLRAIANLVPERIDQGVDYSGYGPIYAIGDGVVLNTVNSGWPGGTFITYRLSDGPAAGLVVYAAEDIEPAVSVGQQVTPNTVLGTMYEGPDGIETGWADSSGQGYTMAHDYGQFSGANSTAFGANFSQLLASLGAPPGVLQNSPPTGSLPPNWPTW